MTMNVNIHNKIEYNIISYNYNINNNINTDKQT
jgi:hypothetical protein